MTSTPTRPCTDKHATGFAKNGNNRAQVRSASLQNPCVQHCKRFSVFAHLIERTPRIRAVTSTNRVRMRNLSIPRRAHALSFVLLSALVRAAAAQNAQPAAVVMGPHKEPPPSIGAVRLTAPVTIDGRLDEDVWRTAP